MRELVDIINIASVILEVMIGLNCFRMMSKKQQLSRRAGMIVSCVCVLVQSLMLLFVDHQLIVTMFLLVVLLGLSFIYQMAFLKRVLYSVILIVLFALTEWMVGLVLSVVLEVSPAQFSKNILYYLEGVVLSKLLMFAVVKLICFFRSETETKVSGLIFLVFSALPLATFLTVYVLAEFTYQYRKGMLLNLSIAACFALIVANVLVLYLFEYQVKMSAEHVREQLEKQQLEYKAEYYKELSVKQKITNKTMHDLKNQLFALQEILKKDSTEGKKKIDAICNDILPAYSLHFTGVESVDALITAKLQIMKEQHIEFTHKIYVSKLNYIDSMDVCAILGNLLDNAIEANHYLKEADRHITMDMMQKYDYLTICISNPVEGTMKNDILSTTKKQKELHGFGIKNVKEIADRYNGSCSFSQGQNQFDAVVMLKNE